MDHVVEVAASSWSTGVDSDSLVPLAEIDDMSVRLVGIGDAVCIKHIGGLTARWEELLLAELEPPSELGPGTEDRGAGTGLVS